MLVTSYRSHIYTHPGESCIATANVLISGSGQIITYRADRLRPLVEPNL